MLSADVDFSRVVLLAASGASAFADGFCCWSSCDGGTLPDRRGRLHDGANALLMSAGADGGCRSVDVGAPFHASSLKVKGAWFRRKCDMARRASAS